MTLLWPGRAVTPEATYDPAHIRFELGGSAEVLDKQGVSIATIDTVNARLVSEGAATGSAIVRQRWEIEAADGTRWLAELLGSCGCGSTRTTGSNPAELLW